MSESGKVQLPWADIDTLLLDMDGTLLDLAFDNFFWLELVPGAYAESRGISLDAARDEVLSRYAPVVGTLPWYCLDHWTGEFGLDLEAMKRAHSDRIRWLPQAEAFLAAARQLGKRLILVTNAHRATLRIKCQQTGVAGWMDAVVSSHDYGVEKEHVGFWECLERELAIRPDRCLLIEDSLAVLETAAAFGIAHMIAISRPDTSQAPRRIERFLSVAGVASLIP
jgi:putative hydrolase of the HAD superfamily